MSQRGKRRRKNRPRTRSGRTQKPATPGAFIVKAQRCLADSKGQLNKVLLYNEDRSVTYEAQGPEAESVLAMMGDKLKIYLWAQMRGTQLSLGLDDGTYWASEQEW